MPRTGKPQPKSQNQQDKRSKGALQGPQDRHDRRILSMTLSASRIRDDRPVRRTTRLGGQ
jgi:hypothetical protein